MGGIGDASVRQPDAIAAGLSAPARRDPIRPASPGNRALRGGALHGARDKPRPHPRGHGPTGRRGTDQRPAAAPGRGPLAHPAGAHRRLRGPRGARGSRRTARRPPSDRGRPDSSRPAHRSDGRSRQGERHRGLFRGERRIPRDTLRAERELQAARGASPAGRRDRQVPGAYPRPSWQPGRVSD